MKCAVSPGTDGNANADSDRLGAAESEGPELPAHSSQSLPWRKSSHSSINGCVEVAPWPEGGVAVRDSKNPENGMFLYTDHEWRAFLAGVKDGEFDDLA